MDFFDMSYYKLNKFFMSFIGHWPYQSKNQRIIISTFFITMNITLIFTLVSGILTSNNFDERSNILTAVLLCIMCLSKQLNSIINTKKMKCLLDQIKSDWILVSGSEVNILKTSASKGRQLSLVYIVYIYASLSVYLLTAYTPQILNIIKPLNESRLRKRTYESNYYVDPEKYYYHITFHEQLATFLNITSFLTIDSMYVVYSEHICGMFAVLRYRLENILKDKNGNWEILEDCSLEKKESLTKEVVVCILLHRRNIKYAKRLDSAFSASLFFQIGLSMILLSVTGYVTILKLNVPDEFMQFFPYVVGQIIYIFYNCLPGQKLIDSSTKTVNSLYNAQWYRMPPKIQKIFILLMVRSSRPCQLQAGGVFILSLQTFSLCIQKAFSFFTVLLSMQE